MDALNARLVEQGYPAALVQVNQHGGGSKCIQCDIFIGAINHLDAEALINAYSLTPWEAADCTQLMIKEEEEDRFTVYTLDYKGNLTRIA